MFVDRSDLATLVDELVSVRGGERVPPESSRPVLVVEGSGGSGRSQFLRGVWNKWAGQAPTAHVDARGLDKPNAPELRPMLLAAMRGLMMREVPGYRVRFPRVIAAHIAMKDPVTDADPGRAADSMRRRLTEYQDRDRLIALVGQLIAAAGTAAGSVADAQLPGSGDAAATTAQEIAPRIVDHIRRGPWAVKVSWGKALDWFGHQDQGFHWDPIEALVHLSLQAASDSEPVRRDVDDLLVTALLADLRESLTKLANRPSNALILIDNGDIPMARAFTTALVRVQGLAADPMNGRSIRPPDPVVVVTASGGALAEELATPGAEPARLDESSSHGILRDVRVRGGWLRVQLDDFTEANVQAMAKTGMWPPTVGSGTVSHLVYRLTAGHAEATGLVLRALAANPGQIGDLDQVLRDKSFTKPKALEDHLLDKIVAGLRPSGAVDSSLRQDLVTLSAARDVKEAESLTRLLRAPNQELLLTSSTLWSGRRTALPPLENTPSAPLLSPLVRYLGLRVLASRAAGATWTTVFGILRDRAAAAGVDDRAGWLHHELALGNRALVTTELVNLLPTIPDSEWLALLDRLTATPDPRRRLAVPAQAPTPPVDPSAVISRLVEGHQAANDPQVSDPEALHYIYSQLRNDFQHLAGNSRIFLQRADYYARLASTVF